MNIRLFLKGVLLYMTILICVLATVSIDSLYDKGYITCTVLIIAGLIYWCKKTITKEELDTLSISR